MSLLVLHVVSQQPFLFRHFRSYKQVCLKISTLFVIPSVKFSHKYEWYPQQHGGPEPVVTNAGGTQRVSRYQHRALPNEDASPARQMTESLNVRG